MKVGSDTWEIGGEQPDTNWKDSSVVQGFTPQASRRTGVQIPKTHINVRLPACNSSPRKQRQEILRANQLMRTVITRALGLRDLASVCVKSHEGWFPISPWSDLGKAALLLL